VTWEPLEPILQAIGFV